MCVIVTFAAWMAFSFEKPASITASASNDDLSTGANWNIVNDGTKAIPHKSIAIARIISRG